MEIEVSRTTHYSEVVIRESNATISSGLLDGNEALALAKDFLYTAERLLPVKYEKAESKLAEIREELETPKDGRT